MGAKLSNMDLPKHPMEYCEKCKEWVPDLRKHDKKRHGKLNTIFNKKVYGKR